MSKVGETIRVSRPASLVLLWWAPLRGCTRIQYQHAPSRRACGDTAASNCTAVSYCQVLLLEYLRQQTLILVRLYRVHRVWCTSVEVLLLYRQRPGSQPRGLLVYMCTPLCAALEMFVPKRIHSFAQSHLHIKHGCHSRLHVASGPASFSVLPGRRHRYHYYY